MKTRAGIHPRPHPTSRRGVPCGHPPLPIIPAQSQPSEDEGGNPSFVTAPYPSCPHPFRHSRVEPALVKTPAGIHPLPHPTSRRGVPRGRPPATFTPIPSPHMSFRAKRSGVEESRCPRNPRTPSFIVLASRSCPREDGGRGPILAPTQPHVGASLVGALPRHSHPYPPPTCHSERSEAESRNLAALAIPTPPPSLSPCRDPAPVKTGGGDPSPPRRPPTCPPPQGRCIRISRTPETCTLRCSQIATLHRSTLHRIACRWCRRLPETCTRFRRSVRPRCASCP